MEVVVNGSNKLIYKKMNMVMADIGHVSKDQLNKAQGFKFRGIDQFINALYPALVKHGVFVTPRCLSYQQELREVVRSSGSKGVDKHVQLMMEYIFTAEDGSSTTIGPVPSEGLDSGDKATNKALSAALKYALIQTYFVPTEDMEEADNHSPTIGVKDAEPKYPKQVVFENGPAAQAAPVAVETPVAAAPKARPAKPVFSKPAANGQAW